MSNDNTLLNSLLGFMSTIFIKYLPEIQALIVFLCTVTYLYWKIREARAAAKEKEEEFQVEHKKHIDNKEI